MQNEKTDPVGVPAAIAALGLTPGALSSEDVHVCSADKEHDIIEISLVAWDPVFQRHRVTGYDNRAVCNYCDAAAEKKPVSFRSATAIACLLQNIDRDLRNLAHLLSGRRREPLKRHVCSCCGSTEVGGKAWTVYDPVSKEYEIIGYLSGNGQAHGVCSSCGAGDARMAPMSNHEFLVAADRMRDELARLRSERAEIDSWLAANSHIYDCAPRATSPSLQVKSHA